MAKHIVTHSCGHRQEHTLTGNAALREGRVAWLARSECTTCYRTDKRAAEAARADDLAAELALPALIGSDKQIAWAQTIRATKIAALRALLDNRIQLVDTAIAMPALETTIKAIAARVGSAEMTCKAVLAALCAEGAAKWWIDHRDLTTSDLLMIAAKRAVIA